MGSAIFYHMAIFKDGSYKQYRRLGEWPRATRNNNDGFHIVLQWNFDTEEPTQAQLQTLRDMIKDLRSDYWLLPVFEHGELEGEATSCAGKHFDTSMISPPTIDLNPTNYGKKEQKKIHIEKVEPVEGKKKEVSDHGRSVGKYHLSRYYWPVEWQKKYAKGSYQADLQMNCGGSCEHTASWHPLTPADAGIVMACPPNFEFGTKLRLVYEWGGTKDVVCLDRWGAIQWRRLDMRSGKGDEWYNNIFTTGVTITPAGYVEVFVVW